VDPIITGNMRDEDGRQPGAELEPLTAATAFE
jgi:hypothetical protein